MKYFTPIYKSGKNLRPPDLYEFYVDNYWFKTAGIEHQKINEPLRGSHKADILILGGGFTGLSAAYNIRKRFPEKEIVLLDGAFCGYGASGRNGGFCITTSLMDWEQEDPEQIRKDLEVSSFGIQQIKSFVEDYGVDCDFAESGMLEVALDKKQTLTLEKYARNLDRFGLDSALLYGKDLEVVIKSPLFLSGIRIPHGATLNPAKLVRGMKGVVEGLGVKIHERSVVTRIIPGKVHQVDTELGDINAPILVLAMNAYGHQVGFFQNRIFPISVFQIATEPLTEEQWESVGWKDRFGLSDLRSLFSYSVKTVDGRIVMGGSDFTYYDFDALSSGNDKTVTARIVNDLFSFFPQLKGLSIAHAWGGTTAYTLGRIPVVGMLGEYNNIYYGTGFDEGVPSCQIAGRMIADLIAKESNIFTNHYIINRKIPYAGPKILRGFIGRGVKWMMKNLDYSPIH